jgi:hypothetical protein
MKNLVADRLRVNHPGLKMPAWAASVVAEVPGYLGLPPSWLFSEL